jgi:hypothetical protein
MRNCKDAKLMAKSLRDSLAARSIVLSHSECIEIVAKQFGFADWNTLSAKLDVVESQHLARPEDAASTIRPGISRAPDPTSGISTHEQIFCSFCGTSQHEARSLIEGGCRNPALSQCVFICDECVAFSAQVIDDSMGNAKETPELTG